MLLDPHRVAVPECVRRKCCRYVVRKWAVKFDEPACQKFQEFRLCCLRLSSKANADVGHTEAAESQASLLEQFWTTVRVQQTRLLFLFVTLELQQGLVPLEKSFELFLGRRLDLYEWGR